MEGNRKMKQMTKQQILSRTRKIKKQLEGLDLASKLVSDLLKSGLGTMGDPTIATYRQIIKQLGDYYLPGPQRLLSRLLLEIEQFQKDGDGSHYETAIKILERMGTLIKKSRVYLNKKLESGDVGPDDNMLYEELGGIWKMKELAAIGNSKPEENLVQTAFWVEYDETGKRFVDTGCWTNLETGETSMSYNYRPISALKYVEDEDSVFGVVKVREAVYYPGDGNRRVRWDWNGTEIRPMMPGDIETLRSLASRSLKNEEKAAKNLLKNALSAPTFVCLVAYDRIGRTDMGYVLESPDGTTILLGDRKGMETTVNVLELIPDEELFRNQVLLGAFYYDAEAGRLKLQPLSIVTKKEIACLLY